MLSHENGLYLLTDYYHTEHITQIMSHDCGNDLKEEYHFHFTDEKKEMLRGVQVSPPGSHSSQVLIGVDGTCQDVS